MTDNKKTQGYETESSKIFGILKKMKDQIGKRYEKQFKDYNITGPQGMTIGIIIKNGPMKISGLSKELGLSNSTVSGIVDRLEKMELVYRERDDKDRRVVNVNVTPSFKEIAFANHDSIKGHLSSIIDLATPEELNTMQQGFDILDKLLDRAIELEKE